MSDTTLISGAIAPALFKLARRICVSACLLFGVMPAWSQEGAGTISGRVQNATNGNYLNNAVVSIEDGRTVFTDEFGDFRISGVPLGTVTLRVSYTGLEAQTAEIEVTAGENTVRNFRLGGRGATVSQDQDEIIELDSFEVAAARETNAGAIAAQEQRYAATIKNVVSSDAF
ncbi:MAG: carboxypeptidase-like regulatory domain-containing protein [Opitutaceae bacterium]